MGKGGRANMPGEGDDLSTWMHRRDEGSPYADRPGASPGSRETRSMMDAYGSPYNVDGGGETPRQPAGPRGYSKGCGRVKGRDSR